MTKPYITELDPASPQLPSCPGGVETLNLSSSEAELDIEGGLVPRRYRNYSLHRGQYCAHWDPRGHLMALICNPCSNTEVRTVEDCLVWVLSLLFVFQLVCIDLCCPHGEAFLANPDYDYTDYTQPAFTCQPELEAGTFRHEVKDNQTEEVVEWEESRHYLLRARAGGFQCPPRFAGHTWVPEYLGNFTVLTSGALRGSELPADSGGETQYWAAGEFCMVKRTPEDYPDLEMEDTQDELSLTFMHCLGREEPTATELFANTFQPVALAISTVFMILTLIVFIIIPKLRESLAGKITLGFISNLILCYIALTDTKESSQIIRLY